jgi:hypothetical protein
MMRRLRGLYAARRLRPTGGLQAVLALGCGIVLGVVSAALGLTCNRRIVSEGQTSGQVMALCGEPTYTEENVSTVPQLLYDETLRRYILSPFSVRKIRWIYDFGTNRLVYILTFEENRLVRIETGDYGR